MVEVIPELKSEMANDESENLHQQLINENSKTSQSETFKDIQDLLQKRDELLQKRDEMVVKKQLLNVLPQDTVEEILKLLIPSVAQQLPEINSTAEPEFIR